MRLSDILELDQELYGTVLVNLEPFAVWFANSQTPFFPEYTDHGPQHVSDVLTATSSLISDSSWVAITPSDISTLIFSVLLHDSAMHLSEDGFLTIIKGDTQGKYVEGFGDKPWPEIWQDFLSEASRFDGRKLQSIFGSLEPIKRPPDDPSNWTKRDRILIGEFLRRHHARLAHEIALWGVPGPNESKINLKDISDEKRDISGLIARSHGTEVRLTIDYLVKNYKDRREYQGIHAVFLMTVLRLADLLQIHEERAPKQMLKIKSLDSPVSQKEWDAHHAIKDIRNTHEDPEAIFIDAHPEDVQTYLKIKELLLQIQSEMDSSWAILGEVYGRFKELKDFGLTIRRIRSNLDDVESFSKNVDYIPSLVYFQAADADLLKLLISPLYGDRPEIGVRELIQNSVDAVLELWEYQKQRPELKNIHLTPQKADVVVSLKKQGSDYILEISDQGIGMTAETVQQYFLKAGASFRRSDQWRAQFEDSEGKSRVLRAGRFGIGLLAAFLLGNDIHVSTRHVDVPEDEGLEFEAGVESDEINIKKIKRPVGTLISILILKERMKLFGKTYRSRFPWLERMQWYCLKSPSVNIYSPQTPDEIEQNYILPSSGSKLPDDWRRIKHPDFKDIHWSYVADSPNVVCNGIFIGKQSSYGIDKSLDFSNPLGSSSKFIFGIPKLSIFDPDGNLPLNLQRDNLIEDHFPFEKELLADIHRDFAAYCLKCLPYSIELKVPIVRKLNYNYPGLKNNHSRNFYNSPNWIISPNGVLLFDDWNLHKLKPRNAVLIDGNCPSVLTSEILLEGEIDHDILIIANSGSDGNSFYRWIREALSFSPLGLSNVVGGRILIPSIESDIIMGGGRIHREYLNRVQVEWERNSGKLWKFGNCHDSLIDFKRIASKSNKMKLTTNVPTVFELYFDCDNKKVASIKMSEPAKAWEKYIKLPYVPFSSKKRKEIIDREYEELKPYLLSLEAQNKLKEEHAAIKRKLKHRLS